jgi:hypothetical protein
MPENRLELSRGKSAEVFRERSDIRHAGAGAAERLQQLSGDFSSHQHASRVAG